MEKGYGLYSQGSSGWTSMKIEEFQEEDIWGIFKDKSNSSSKISTSSREPSIISKRLPSANRMIPKSTNKSIISSQEPKIIQHSAPQNIPDWSKVCGDSPAKSGTWVDPDPDDDADARREFRGSSWESEDEDEHDKEGRVVPPHEWIARKLARRQISSFSVCEGAGRTLKGEGFEQGEKCCTW